MSSLESIGPYRIVRPLGRGGMGAVYLAHDTRLGRNVALKLFVGGDSRGEFARRELLNEARAVAALNHPHIAAVHDIVEADGHIAIVFEYIEGETLAQRIERGPLDVPHCLRIAMQVVEALAAAHQQGVVHRDLKPANIVVTADHVVKVLDFGVARMMTPGAHESGTAVTTIATFVGTVGYAAPEQCLGHNVDARADIFSLGVLMFEMLSGRRPYPDGDASAVLQAMLTQPTPRVRASVPEVPAALDACIARMLSSNPAERPDTMTEVRRLLHGFAPAPSSREESPVPRQRRPWAMLAVGASALGTTALVSTLLLDRTLNLETPVAAGSPVVAVMALTNASGDPARDYVATGVEENLITQLASVPSITVLSRAAVSEAQSRHKDPTSLARELDATYLVDGSVQQIGDRLRIDLRLIERDGSVEWADDVEGEFRDVFNLQRRLTAMIAQALEVRLSPAERASLARQSTSSPQALDAYWRARTFLRRPDLRGNLDAAIQAFREATERDPRFAEAYAGMGEAFWTLYLGTRDPQHARAAEEAGMTALRLGPDLPEVRYALAVTLAGTGKINEAVEELQRALALRPHYEEARIQLGRTLVRAGRTGEGIAEFQKVTDIRPGNANAWSALGLALFENGRFREAADAFERVTAIQPDNAIAHQQAGVAYHSLGDVDRALQFYQKSLDIQPQPQAYSNIGAIYHQRGEYEKAVSAYRQAIALRPNSRETHRNLGDALAKMGQVREARRAWERAIELTRADLNVNPNNARVLASLGVYLQKAGHREEARSRIADAVGLAPADFEVLRRAAQVHALAGRHDEALDALEKAIQSGFSRETAAREDELESLRGLPRFSALVGAPQ